MRNAFHQAAVAQEHPGAVVDDLVLGPVVALGQQLFGQRKAHGVGQALAERPGGGFHAGGFMMLRMAGGLAAELTELLELLDRQVVAAQVQQRVLQHRAVAVGQHEAVAVEPLGVVGVVTEIVVPEDLGDIGHAHRHAGMPGLGGFDRISGKEADGIGQLAAGRLRHGSESREAPAELRAANCPTDLRRGQAGRRLSEQKRPARGRGVFGGGARQAAPRRAVSRA